MCQKYHWHYKYIAVFIIGICTFLSALLFTWRNSNAVQHKQSTWNENCSGIIAQCAQIIRSKSTVFMQKSLINCYKHKAKVCKIYHDALQIHHIVLYLVTYFLSAWFLIWMNSNSMQRERSFGNEICSGINTQYTQKRTNEARKEPLT